MVEETVLLRVIMTIAALGWAGFAMAADHPTTFALNGGQGDIHNALVCADGTYVKGFRGRVGDWIDRLTVICTKEPLKPGGHVGGSKSIGSFGGDGGNEVDPMLCQDALVGKMREFLTSDNRMVSRVTFTCRSPATGKDVEVLRFGSIPGGTYEEQDCPPGEIATGVEARWGKHVNAVALICNKIKIAQ
jgi:hypothetical protein